MNGSRPSQNPADAPKPALATLPPRKYWPWFFLVLLVNYLLMSLWYPQGDTPVTVPYTVFREEAAKGNVTAIYSRNTSIQGRFKSAVTWPTPEDIKQVGQPSARSAIDRRLLPSPRTSVHFTTELPAFFDRNLESFLVQHKVEISAVPIQQGGGWGTLLYGSNGCFASIATRSTAWSRRC